MITSICFQPRRLLPSPALVSVHGARRNICSCVSCSSFVATRLPRARVRPQAAAILNSLAGWRIEVNAKRSAAASKKLGSPTTIHYLDGSLHANRMSKKTLDAMMSAITAAKPVGQRALRLQARALKVPALHPCDLLAPPPAFPGAADGPGMPYPEGLDTVAQAVGDVDGSIGEFVRMMAKRRWIEGSEGDAKRPGAYCTMFSKSRAPRVYLSAYNGSLGVRSL